jgi:putative tryptophan/tyrosine transport system substrate-binding protein
MSGMRRRKFITLLGGAAVAWPLAARAQQTPKVARIGVLGSTFASPWASRIEAFRSGLRDLGYVEGENIVIEFRWAEEKYDQLPHLAAELIRLKVDVLVTYGTPGSLLAKRATTTVPIVMVHSGDAVAAGIVKSLVRPGGNLTGMTYFLPELMAKRIEMLREVVPRIRQVAIPVKPDNAFFTTALRALEGPAKSLDIRLQQFEVREANDFADAFAAMPKSGVDAVVILEDAVFVSNARIIADLAAKHRLPSAGFDDFAQAGGLIGYGIDFLEMYRRAAVFVDKILKGAKPADLPIEQATKFVAVINMKTAKALGLEVPVTLLVRADEVIE